MGKNPFTVTELTDVTNSVLAQYVPEYDRENFLRGIRERSMPEKHLFKANYSMEDSIFRGLIGEHLDNNGHENYQLYGCSVRGIDVEDAYITIASRSDSPKNLALERRIVYIQNTNS